MVLISLAGCDGSALESAPEELAEEVDSLLVVEVDSVPRYEFLAAQLSRLVFVNTEGGTYHHGNSYDTQANTAPLLESSVTFPAYEGTSSERAAVIGCLQEMFGAYGVEIVTENPGTVPHLELVLGGTPGLAGVDPSWSGVAPIASDCSVLDGGIGFTFSGKISGTRKECEVAAHEIGHLLGLDHSFLCSDTMSYLGCGDKAFRDQFASCGENSARDCQCSQTQNTHQHLLSAVGPPAQEEQLPFDDIRFSIFKDSILWMLEQGITKGCSANRYCPGDDVTRGQMAAFLVRALELPSAPSAGFEDTQDSIFIDDIDRLAAAGITKGCGGDRFCPLDNVTRGQMAAFLHRALGE